MNESTIKIIIELICAFFPIIYILIINFFTTMIKKITKRLDKLS